MDKLEATYNRSIKIMYNLPWPTHRNFLEPLTDSVYIRRNLIQRYLSFISRIEKSKKKPLRTLLNMTKYDVRAVTGSNLRYKMLNAGKTSISELLDSKVHILRLITLTFLIRDVHTSLKIFLNVS